jgi:3-demethoxyubiquinol 3-hydroxylase
MSPTEPAPSCVLFDGSCPLCRQEIALYRALPATQPIQWVDVSYLSDNAQFGADPAELMRRFHVVTSSGQLLSGARAFVHLWSLLPGWKYLAYVAKIPGVVLLMEGCYRLFLRVRPRLQKMARQRAASAAPLPHSETL